MSATFKPFTPSAAVADAVIDALGSPDHTLRDVSRQFHTSLEALTLWMTRPDIAARLDAIQSAVTRRSRLMATNFLPGVVKLLNQIINHHFADEHEHESSPLAPEPRRHRENARKAAALLVRLTGMQGTPALQPARALPPPTAESPSSPSAAAGGTGVPPVPIAPKTTKPERSSPHASMPPAPMPSSTSTPAPSAAPVVSRALPSLPSSSLSSSSLHLPNLVAQAAGLCPTPSTSLLLMTPARRAPPNSPKALLTDRSLKIKNNKAACLT